MTGEFAIDTHALTKRYDSDVLAVDRLALRVRRGEVYGFVGPNGAGKTTTLRMLLGLVRPSSGSARVLGARPGDPEALGRIGSMVEAPGFYPYLSGHDNLRVVARYASAPEVRIGAVLDRVGLGERGRRRFATYSLGMKQRLGVAAALLKEPDLLILDEPTNGLDPSGMADTRRLIRSLGDSGHTVVLSSHLMGEVEQISDRVGVIRAGALVAEGPVDELRGRPLLRVRTDALEATADVLGRMREVGDVRRVNGHLDVAIDVARAPEVTRALVAAGIGVLEIAPQITSLEDVFLDITHAGGPGET